MYSSDLQTTDRLTSGGHPGPRDKEESHSSEDLNQRPAEYYLTYLKYSKTPGKNVSANYRHVDVYYVRAGDVVSGRIVKER